MIAMISGALNVDVCPTSLRQRDPRCQWCL
jgi:hypothetical protein